MTRYHLERLARKYWKLAGDIGFIDSPRLGNAQHKEASEQAHKVHDELCRLGEMLDKLAAEATR